MEIRKNTEYNQQQDIAEQFILEENGTIVHVTINYTKKVVYTFIERPTGTPKVPGTTKALYKAAYNLMREKSTELRPLTYIFTTRNDAMRAWAKTSGREIFQWDRLVEDLVQDTVRTHGEKIIFP